MGPAGPTGATGATGPAGSGGTSVGLSYLNVRDYPGVDPNGGNDSAPGIQACFNEAFGPPGNPHGNGGRNRIVVIPEGGYKLLSPLVLTAVWGGKIVGGGQLQTWLSYQGPMQPVTSEGWIPTLWLNGCNYCEIDNIGFAGLSDPGGKTVGMWWGPDGALGGSSAHGNLIRHCMTGGQLNYGIIHGSTNSAANSENTYLDCTLLGVHDVGLFISGANTLNFRWIGGAFDQCKTGIKTNNAATVPIIDSPACANNALDFDFAASAYATIRGVRSESGQLLRSNSPVQLTDCHGSVPGDRFTGSVSGTTLTVTALGSRGFGCMFPGQIVFGPGLRNQYNSQQPGQGLTRIVRQIDGNQWGIGTYELSWPGDVPPGTVMNVAAPLIELVGAATATLINCGSDNDQCIVGDGNSALSIKGNLWYSSNDAAMAPHLLAAYSGQVFDYDIMGYGGGQNLVENLPAPRACLKGVRMFVTDNAVTTWGSTVLTGTGGNRFSVPVYCDGAAWRVG